MRSAVLLAPRKFDLIDCPIPEPGPREVLVRVAICGVCTSELDVWDGKAGDVQFPRFPGHEVAGIVEKLGSDVKEFHPGDRVAVWVTERGFSDYVLADVNHCFRLQNVPIDQALIEPLACAVNAVELTNVSLGDDVLVVGAGYMGSLVLKLLKLQGVARLIVADIRPEVLKLASNIGATHLIDLAKEDIKHTVAELTDSKGVDAVFEVTGHQAPLNFIGDIVRMHGKIAIVGYHQGEPRCIPLGQWNYKALQIVNCHFRDPKIILRGMSVGVKLMENGLLTMGDLITHRFPLGSINDAFATAERKPDGFIKSVVSML